MTTPRRVRAEDRVVSVCYPDGTRVGYLVQGWRDGQLPIGPFMNHDAAIEAALENTAGLARGQQIRQEGRTR